MCGENGGGQAVQGWQTLLSLQMVSTAVDTLRWWENHSSDLPWWSSAVRKMFLLQPSSAAAERVFSISKNTFGDQQQTSLGDYVEASLIVQYKCHG